VHGKNEREEAAASRESLLDLYSRWGVGKGEPNGMRLTKIELPPFPFSI